MSKTYGEQPGPTPEYRKAETRKMGESDTKTDRVGRSPRSIATSCTEGTIEVIIVNKPDSAKSIDKSTS